MPGRRIAVVAYSPEWPQRFRAEAELLASWLGPDLLAIHHIGSTSVPGIPAKAIIDMLLVVPEIGVADGYAAILESRGYLAKGEFGISGRRFFIKGTEEIRTHHLHFFARGHPRIETYLDFRNYLRAHQDAAAIYGRLKERLAREYPEDPDGYMAGKEGMIQELNRRAREWRRGG